MPGCLLGDVFLGARLPFVDAFLGARLPFVDVFLGARLPFVDAFLGARLPFENVFLVPGCSLEIPFSLTGCLLLCAACILAPPKRLSDCYNIDTIFTVNSATLHWGETHEKLFIIIVTILLSGLISFTIGDIEGHWAKPYIDYLIDKQAIAGYPDNTFKLEDTLSVGDIAYYHINQRASDDLKIK